MVQISFCWVNEADTDLGIPSYETVGSSGADLRANIRPSERSSGIILQPGDAKLIPTGLKFKIPKGYEVQIRPRSGLSINHKVTVLNSPGTIDSDYRGEVSVILINMGQKEFLVIHGSRIAQMVVAPVIKAKFTSVNSIGNTLRGTGGFGSTGMN